MASLTGKNFKGMNKMTQEELTELNLGQSLDDLANLDPRGYGVCKILYSASRKYTGAPTSMNAAKKLVSAIKKDDVVCILTGFVLYPYKKAETDGLIGSMLLCRALAVAFDAKPVIICPEECIEAVKNISSCIGMTIAESADALMKTAYSMSVCCFTKDKNLAPKQADEIIQKFTPSAVISIECPGANEKGIYHNAKGIDVTELEAGQDVLFEKLKAMGILNIAIGDLGNEIGMGSIAETLHEYIPYAGTGRCSCSCGGGIAVNTKADNLITATVSDWGCYAMIAALAYLKNNVEIMHTAELEKEVLCCAGKYDIIDMSGQTIPAIDGFGLEIILPIVSLMRELLISSLKLKESCATWFEKVDELKFFER